MKSVLVIGAGPSGLVAAKTLIQNGNFKVTVFEAAERVGGMWRARSNEPGDKCSPYMTTNLSRFTVAFPDLAWTSVDLSDPVTGAPGPENPPMFPRAWQVGRYLEAYSQKYIPADAMRLNRRVTKVDFTESSASWNIVSHNCTTKEENNDTFDYLIIGSGFFNKPAREYPSPSSAPNSSSIQHSSQFREVAALTVQPGKIVVFGGGISGGEAAATAAFQISSAKYSPGASKPSYAESKIYHVLNRPFYCLPRYIPQDPYSPATQDFALAPNFLPVDLGLYNLSRRGDGQIVAGLGTVPADKAKKGHEFLRSLIGGDQRDIGCSALVSKPETTQYPGYTSLTDLYSEFVRSGLIVPIQGRVVNIESSSGNNTHTMKIEGQSPWTEPGSATTIDDIVGIIDATGYNVSVDYLNDRVKEALSYDPTYPRVPFLLSRGSVFAPKVPNLAFVGFYEGPYWGVMEMQARLIARMWDLQSKETAPPESLDTEVSESVRKALRESPLEVPPFWMADYLGIIDEFSRKAGMNRDDSLFNGQNGPTFPSRYQGPEPSDQVREVVNEVAQVLKDSTGNARFVAAAVFRAMQGSWILRRKVDSRIVHSLPGGTLKGTAHFHPRSPTDPMYASEYLYIEEGTFTMDNGFSFPATRRYVYRYNEATDTITAWFADEDGESAGAIFTTLEFSAPEDNEHGWIAKGHHWCDPDTYKSSCEFRFRGAGLRTFGITYMVEGPHKDYTHESWYERPEPQDISV